MLGTGKSRGLYGVLGPRARLQSEGKWIASSWIFRTSWETPITQRSCPTASLTIRLTPPPLRPPHTALPSPSPGLRADASPSSGALCRGSNQCREDKILPPVLQLLEPGPQAAPPPLAAVCQHPLLLPQRRFPLFSLF